MGEHRVTDDIWNKIKQNCKPQWITAFAACFVIGLLTYGFFMANRFLTYDSLWNIHWNQDMITSGRQFLTYACSISSDYDLPWLNGVLAIFYLAVTSVLLVEIFEIRGHIAAALAAGLLVTFPSVTSTFCYSYTVDGYMLAVLLITLAFYLTQRQKRGFLPGAVLVGISLGIYQAYLSYLMILCILTLLLLILKEQNVKALAIRIGKYAVMGAGGYAFYLISLKLMLAVKGVSLSGYQGVDQLNSFSFSELPAGLQSAWKSFEQFARYENVLTTTSAMTFAFVALALLGVGMYAYLFLREKTRKRWLMVISAVVLVIAIPFCATVINVISPQTHHHLLMRNAWSLFFIFVVVLMERCAGYATSREQKVKGALSLAVMLCSALLILEFGKMANIAGFNMQERYEKNYGLALRIVEQLEETPGYEHGMKVAILGGEPDESIFPSTDITGEDLVGYFGVAGDYSLNSTEKFATFMSHFLNVTITTIEYEEELELAGSPEFQEMEKFPYEGCIRRIGDVWVVKLNG